MRTGGAGSDRRCWRSHWFSTKRVLSVAAGGVVVGGLHGIHAAALAGLFCGVPRESPWWNFDGAYRRVAAGDDSPGPGLAGLNTLILGPGPPCSSGCRWGWRSPGDADVLGCICLAHSGCGAE